MEIVRMVRVISRKDLNRQDFAKAVFKDTENTKKCSMQGFAEAMYYYYKKEATQMKEGDH